MATAYENNLSCAVCLDLYDDPRFLPCGHSYCLKCLVDLQKKSLNKQLIKCPICQVESSCEYGSQSSYTKNYDLNNLVQSFILESKIKDVTCDVYVCDVCCDSQANAQRACTICEMMYCETCFSTYHPMKGKLGTHKIVNADGYFKCAKDMKSDDRNIYCKDCDTLIMVADLNSHVKHEVVSLDKARSIFKVKLEEDTGDINLMQSTLESAMEKSREKLHTFEAIFKEIEDEVATKKEEVMSKLKSDVKEAEAAIDHVMSAISTHRELQSRADTIYFIEESQNILRRTSIKQDFNNVRMQLDKIDSLTCRNDGLLEEIRTLEVSVVPETNGPAIINVNGRENHTSASVAAPTETHKLEHRNGIAVPSFQFDHQRAGADVRVSRDGKKIALADHAAELLGDHYPEYNNQMHYSNVLLGYPRMTAGCFYWEVESEHAAGDECIFRFGVTSSATPEDCAPGGDASSWAVYLKCLNATTTIIMLHAGHQLNKDVCGVTSGFHTHRYGLLLDIDNHSLSVINVKSKKCIYVFTSVVTLHGVSPVFTAGNYKYTLNLVDPDIRNVIFRPYWKMAANSDFLV